MDGQNNKICKMFVLKCKECFMNFSRKCVKIDKRFSRIILVAHFLPFCILVYVKNLPVHAR